MRQHYYNQKNRRHQNGPSAAVIRYDETAGGAPQVVAQGTGALAVKMMELAKQHGVHMQEDPSLVGQLLDMDLGENVPPQLYSVIAEILILLEEIDR
ncbi:EscU/YscU/HrcU family type III secretion system export apparatus switch protein [Bacillus sp. FJAT-50079]|uniref:EscU/YscU/HrcU family type III secretion system export apparatus switch protein n=1 Tax=Bacillus sp. FJAT-50079 TaxID=2833577 RepID=UPI001BC9CAEC|nr:EscU/YscU/HrcU family type III secretion system export apparatus switch protein [Bacillus sp. FJAT-50079]MBS4208280.1 EscU/YscU/HrcU family type III secretion system export apparatus switch protein [Bacillus sp. FJAT-50079]